MSQERYVSYEEDRLKVLVDMLDKDPGLIYWLDEFIRAHTQGVPLDQPGEVPVFRDYYTADPLTTFQHSYDPFHYRNLEMNVPLDANDFMHLRKIMSKLRTSQARDKQGTY